MRRSGCSCQPPSQQRHRDTPAARRVQDVAELLGAHQALNVTNGDTEAFSAGGSSNSLHEARVIGYSTASQAVSMSARKSAAVSVSATPLDAVEEFTSGKIA